MRTVEEWTVGSIASSIGDLIFDRPGALEIRPLALVTSIDSSTDLTTLRTALQIVERCSGCTFIREGLLIPGADLAAVAEKLNLFNGYDELWWFDRMPIPKPAELTIVSPVSLEVSLPAGLTRWMSESGCLLGLGDGDELNYIARDEGTASRLEEAVRATG